MHSVTLAAWYLLCTGEAGISVTQVILVTVLPSPAHPALRVSQNAAVAKLL